MLRYDPRTQLETHEVTNQAPDLPALDLYAADRPMREAVEREGGAWAHDRLHAMGARVRGRAGAGMGRGGQAQPAATRDLRPAGAAGGRGRLPPRLPRADGPRVRHGVSSLAWTQPARARTWRTPRCWRCSPRPSPATMCPASMTYAAVPALAPPAARWPSAWVPKILDGRYDAPLQPIADKAGITLGMAMTEKQGGSDVRANTTRAHAGGGRRLPAGRPQMVLLRADERRLPDAGLRRGGLSCFLVPRITPDGGRNAIQLMRLKDKLGNKSNASVRNRVPRRLCGAGRRGGPGRRRPSSTWCTTRGSAPSPARSASCAWRWRRPLHHAATGAPSRSTLMDQPADAQRSWPIWRSSTRPPMALVMRVARAFECAPARRSGPSPASAVALAKFWLTQARSGLRLRMHGMPRRRRLRGGDRRCRASSASRR